MFTTYIKNLNDLVFPTVSLQIVSYRHACMPLRTKKMHGHTKKNIIIIAIIIIIDFIAWLSLFMDDF